MKSDNLLEALEDCVATQDMESLEKAMAGSDKLLAAPATVLAALTRGFERARQGLAANTLALPDLLLSIDCFKYGADWVARLAPESRNAKGPVVVIGVVAGDVHHMGKNIVAAVLAANGYNVLDAGRDVENRVFLDLVKQTNAEVLALSAMMSTPQQNMAELITMVRLVAPETSVIVGGASMDAELSRKIGADGFAESAMTVPEEFLRVMRQRKGKR